MNFAESAHMAVCRDCGKYYDTRTGEQITELTHIEVEPCGRGKDACRPCSPSEIRPPSRPAVDSDRAAWDTTTSV